MERNQKGLSELNQTMTSSFNASSEPEDLDVSVHQDSVAFCFTESDGTNIHSEDETHNDHHESRVYRHRKKSVSISLHEQSEHTPTISALDTQSIYLNLGRSISTASTGSNMMSSKECFKKMQEAYTALRAKIDYDSDKYCKQIVLLDYLNLCIQAQEFLKREHYDIAMRFCDAALALQAHACGWRVHDIKAEIFKAKGDDKQAEAEKAIMLEYIKGKDKEGTPEWLAMYYGDIIRNDLAKGKVFQAKKKFQEVIAKLLEQQKTLLSSSDNSRDEQNISRIVEAFQNARDNIKDNNDDAQAQYSLLPRSRKVKKINTSDESLRSNDSSTCDTPSTSSIYDTTYIFDEESSRDEAVISNKESEEQINKAIEETRNTLTLLDYKNLEEALILVRQEIKVMQDTMSHQNSLLSTVTHDLNAVKSEVGDITSYLEELKEHQSRVEAMHEMPKNYELQEYWKAFILTVMQTYSSALVICSGKVSLNTGGILETIIVNAFGFIPFCGQAISNIAEHGIQMVQEVEMRKNANAVILLATSDLDLHNIIKTVATAVISHRTKQEEVYNCTQESRKSVGICSKLINKIKEAKHSVNKILDGGEIYKTPYALLGYQNASEAISKWVSHVNAKDISHHGSFFLESYIIKFFKHAVIPERDWKDDIHQAVYEVGTAEVLHETWV